jgi:hypothetical protein
MIRIVEANAGCYFTVDFGRLVPGFGLPADASTIDGEVALMERMISSWVHIVSRGRVDKRFLISEPDVFG